MYIFKFFVQYKVSESSLCISLYYQHFKTVLFAIIHIFKIMERAQFER